MANRFLLNASHCSSLVHEGRTIPLGTPRAILRDADISVDEFHELR
jgi:hypothetical protein